MTLAEIQRRAAPTMIAAMIIVPAIAIAIERRDLDQIDFFATVDPDGGVAWLLRLTTFVVVATAIALLAARAWLGRQRRSIGIEAAVMLGFAVYFTTNAVLNGLFGTLPAFSHSQSYAALVLLAIYVRRDQDASELLAATKCALLVVMVASLLWAIVDPKTALQRYTLDVRLPFIGFRFWGLGSHPNGIAPMALLLILLTIHRPFATRGLTALSCISGGAVLLLAQSQTAWLAAAIAIPLLLVYRRVEVVAPRRSLWPNLLVASFVAMLLAASVWIALDIDISDTLGLDKVSDESSLSGRGHIWKVAIDTFAENPLFGFGPTAWNGEFRARIGMPFAFTAHNQFLQAMSSAGLVGLSGLLIYYVAMIVAVVVRARPTRGLAPALFIAFPLVRSISETPLSLYNILTDDFAAHVALFIVLVSALPERAAIKPATSLMPGATVGA